jgi:hypothetical protein
MAAYENVQAISLTAGADLSAKQYFFVKADTTDNQVVVCGDGQNAIGVLLNDPTSGDTASVAVSGVVKVYAGGTVTGGGPVASDTNGECVDAANGDYVLGTALEDGADGQVIRVLFDKNGIDPA